MSEISVTAEYDLKGEDIIYHIYKECFMTESINKFM